MKVKLRFTPKHSTSSGNVGISELLSVGSQPPLTVKPAAHVSYAACISASDVHAGSETGSGQLTTISLERMVNVLSQVSGTSKQASSAVRVNVYEPPQAVIPTPGIARRSANVAGRSSKLSVTGSIPPVTLNSERHSR